MGIRKETMILVRGVPLIAQIDTRETAHHETALLSDFELLSPQLCFLGSVSVSPLFLYVDAKGCLCEQNVASDGAGNFSLLLSHTCSGLSIVI